MDLETIRKRKAELRAKLLFMLKNHRIEDKIYKNRIIENKLRNNGDLVRAQWVMTYVATNYEVETKNLIQLVLSSGKRVMVPFLDLNREEIIPVEIRDPGRDLRKGKFGVFEPKRELIRDFNLKDIDVVITPGIAFDQKGNRLGRGKGYYDRFLARLEKITLTIGLAFDFQVLESIPTTPNDIPVRLVISNN